jgi:hypothetical protein
LTITRGNAESGGPTTPSATLLSNLTDGNPATTATCNADGGGSEYFIFDLGSTMDISSVSLSNVTVGPGAICGVDISNTFSITGIPGIDSHPGTEISLVTSGANSSPVTDANLVFVPSSGVSVSGRYLYISFTDHISGTPIVTIGDISLSTGISFAVVQDVKIDMKWDCHELFTAASISDFPIDIGVGESSWKIEAHNIGIRADALQRIVAAELNFAGSEANLTLPETISMPSLLAVFQATDTQGRSVEFTLNNAKASGAQLPFKLNDFVIQGFGLTAYPDQNGVLGTIVFNG